MTKRIISIAHQDVSDVFEHAELSLVELSTLSQEWLAKYGVKAYLEIETDYNCNSGSIKAAIKEVREETDEEYASRLRQEAADVVHRADSRESADRAEYKRLQAKFGKSK